MIKKNLELLGIQFKSQLEQYDIHFWWQKKYTEILKSDFENKNELLISLNNALEDLEKIDISLINAELKTKLSKNKTPKSSKSSKKNKASYENKSFNIPKDGGKEGQLRIEKELGLNNNKISKDNLTSNILIEVNTNQKEQRKQIILNSRSSLTKIEFNNQRWLNQLEEKEIDIVNMLFGINGEEVFTKSEISEVLDISKTTVEKIKSKAFNQLYNDMYKEGKVIYFYKNKEEQVNTTNTWEGKIKKNKEYLRNKFNWIIKEEGLKSNQYSFDDSVVLNEQIIIRDQNGKNIVTYWWDYPNKKWYKKRDSKPQYLNLDRELRNYKSKNSRRISEQRKQIILNSRSPLTKIKFYNQSWLDQLRKQEIDIVNMLFGINGEEVFTKSEISEILDISETIVEKIKSKAFNQLHNDMRKEEGTSTKIEDERINNKITSFLKRLFKNF